VARFMITHDSVGSFGLTVDVMMVQMLGFIT
jgi:hypothetical protein